MRQAKHIPGCESRLTTAAGLRPYGRSLHRRLLASRWLPVLVCLGLAAGWSAAPAGAQSRLSVQKLPASLIGVVTGLNGKPESGALVLLRPLLRNESVWRRTTGPGGTFLIPTLPPGLYWLQAGKGKRLSAPRRLELRQGETVLLTLHLAAAAHRDLISDMQAYRWVLRADAGHRPLLRYRQTGKRRAGDSPALLNGSVAMLAGSGSTAFTMPSALNTNISMHTLADDMLFGFSGSIGTSGWNSSSSFAASMTPELHDWWRGSWRVEVQHIPTPVLGHLPVLNLFTLNYANQASLGRAVQLQYGILANDLYGANSLYQFSPYARLNLQLASGRHLEYRYAAAPPPLDFLQNRLWAPNPAPRVSLNGGRPVMERGLHQEVAFFSSLGPANEIELAWFYDSFHHAIINGSWRGELPSELLNSGYLLPDSYSNLFSADGGSYAGSGMVALLQHQLSQGLSLSLGAEEGPVLVAVGDHMRPTGPAGLLSETRALAFSARLAGEMGPVHTRIICSYRTAGRRQLTTPDPYETDDSGQPFANVQIRQPLPSMPFTDGRIIALMEVQNVLAQGYVPVYSADGHLLYLIQAARALRGGLSFNF